MPQEGPKGHQMDPKIIKNREKVLSGSALRRNLKKKNKNHRFSDPLNLEKLGFRLRAASILTFSVNHQKVIKIDQQTHHFGTFLAQNGSKTITGDQKKRH